MRQYMQQITMNNLQPRFSLRIVVAIRKRSVYIYWSPWLGVTTGSAVWLGAAQSRYRPRDHTVHCLKHSVTEAAVSVSLWKNWSTASATQGRKTEQKEDDWREWKEKEREEKERKKDKKER